MRPLRRILDEHRLTPAAVLLTHGHIDHMWSAQNVSDTYGCPTYIHPEDRCMLTDPIRGFGPRLAQVAFGALFREPRQVVELDRDGDKIELGGITVAVDHTPGHTKGSICFLLEGWPILFSGDTLFPGGPGNTVHGGHFPTIIKSLDERLLPLPAETIVLPGHGLDTTIGSERPHLQEWVDRGF